MIFNKADFIASYGISSQLPESDRPLSGSWLEMP